jgi:hypothetical protein
MTNPVGMSRRFLGRWRLRTTHGAKVENVVDLEEEEDPDRKISQLRSQKKYMAKAEAWGRGEVVEGEVLMGGYAGGRVGRPDLAPADRHEWTVD